MIDKNSEAFLKQQEFLQKISAEYLKRAWERKTINILWISCSTINKDDDEPRMPSSEKILIETMDMAKAMRSDVETKLVKLRDLKFENCEANYSIQWDFCTWPCRISQRLWAKDELIQLYNAIVDRADIILISTPIRRWNPASLYFKLVERLNAIENQKEVYWVDLMHNQQMWFVIVWAQDWVQSCLWNMSAFRLQLWSTLPKNCFVWFTSWWFQNDRTDLVISEIEKNKDYIKNAQTELLVNQFKLIDDRRKG